MKKSVKTMRWFMVMVISTFIMMTATVFSASAEEIVTSNQKTENVVTIQASGDAASGLINWITSLNGTVKSIGLAIAILAVLFLAISLFFGGNGAIPKLKSTGVAIIGGIALLGFGPTLITEIANATGA